MQDSLETDNYLYATFVSVSTQSLPASYSDGQTINFKLIGNLTMHGKTNAETFAVQGKVERNTITGTATCTIYVIDLVSNRRTWRTLRFRKIRYSSL